MGGWGNRVVEGFQSVEAVLERRHLLALYREPGSKRYGHGTSTTATRTSASASIGLQGQRLTVAVGDEGVVVVHREQRQLAARGGAARGAR